MFKQFYCVVQSLACRVCGSQDCTMAMKIKPYNDNETDSLSLSAKATRFLVRINMIPVSVNKAFTDATFSVFSFRTLVYLIVANSPGFSIGITWLLQPDFANEYFMKAANCYVTFEKIVSMFFYFLMFILQTLYIYSFLVRPFVG